MSNERQINTCRDCGIEILDPIIGERAPCPNCGSTLRICHLEFGDIFSITDSLDIAEVVKFIASQDRPLDFSTELLDVLNDIKEKLSTTTVKAEFEFTYDIEKQDRPIIFSFMEKFKPFSTDKIAVYIAIASLIIQYSSESPEQTININNITLEIQQVYVQDKSVQLNNINSKPTNDKQDESDCKNNPP